MFRIVSIVLGYIFGNILTACIVTKHLHAPSPFEMGSGNPGMANVMARCGFKPGICALAGDLIKTVIPCLLCRFVLYPEVGVIACLYAGLGTVLGHNYPIWHRFKGGKGVSATCAAMFCIHPLLGIAAMLVGMFVVFGTKYLSIGAACIPVAFIPAAYYMAGTEGAVAYIFLSLAMLFAHRHDFARIKAGTEERIDVPAMIKRNATHSSRNKPK